MKREELAMGGALGASVLVASCCLGPALAIFFGVSISGLSWLSFFAPYRWLFIGLGILCLGYAACLLHGPNARSQAGPCEGQSCATSSLGPRTTRAVFWLSVIVFAVANMYPYLFAAYLDAGTS